MATGPIETEGRNAFTIPGEDNNEGTTRHETRIRPGHSQEVYIYDEDEQLDSFDLDAINRAIGKTEATGRPGPKVGPLDTVRSEDGRIIPRRNLGPEDVVTLPSGEQDTLEILLMTGQARVNPNSGLYELVGEGAQEPTEGEDADVEAKADPLAAYKGQPISDEAESIIDELVSYVPEASLDALAHGLVMGDLEPAVVEDMAVALGVPLEEAQQRVHNLAQAGVDKIVAVIESTGLPAGEVIHHMRTANNGHAWRDALTSMIHDNRNMTGFLKSARKLAQNLDTVSPHLIESATVNGGRVFRDNNGQLLVQIGEGDPMSWPFAVKQGYVRIRKNTGK